MWQENNQLLCSSDQPLEIKETIITPDDMAQHKLGINSSFDFRQNRPFGDVVIDVTELKRTEEYLQCMKCAMDHAGDAVYWIDHQARIVYANNEATAMLGYSTDEFLRMTVHDLNPNISPEKWPRLWAKNREKKTSALETVHLSKDDRHIPIDIRMSFLAYEDQEFQCVFAREIIERTGAKEAVRDSELRYTLLTEATFDGIAVHDQGVIVEVNARLERMFGYGPGEIIGRSILDIVADESRNQVVVNMWNNVSEPYETIGCRKDGTTFPVEVVVRSYSYRGKEVHLVVGRDITDRKHLEMERSGHREKLERQIVERTTESAALESQQAQREKLAAMGRLAAGIAHEINNSIAGIKSAFILVKQAVDSTHPHAEFADMIDREIARVASIIRNMYQLYQPEVGMDKTVEIKTLIHDVEAFCSTRLQQHRLVLRIELDPYLERFRVPRGGVRQVILNLLTNAIDCSSEGSAIVLTLRAEPDAVRIAVSDEGPGILPENLPHIFDPFFTTKVGSGQKGMGLGLSVSQSLVMAMGGRIEVQTQLQNGSTFSVFLPRQTAAIDTLDQFTPITGGRDR